jgi:hypothetical protein
LSPKVESRFQTVPNAQVTSIAGAHEQRCDSNSECDTWSPANSTALFTKQRGVLPTSPGRFRMSTVISECMGTTFIATPAEIMVGTIVVRINALFAGPSCRKRRGSAHLKGLHKAWVPHGKCQLSTAIYGCMGTALNIVTNAAGDCLDELCWLFECSRLTRHQIARDQSSNTMCGYSSSPDRHTSYRGWTGRN